MISLFSLEETSVLREQIYSLFQISESLAFPAPFNVRKQIYRPPTPEQEKFPHRWADRCPRSYRLRITPETPRIYSSPAKYGLIEIYVEGWPTPGRRGWTRNVGKSRHFTKTAEQASLFTAGNPIRKGGKGCAKCVHPGCFRRG